MRFAREKLQALGPVTLPEKITLGVFALLLVLWAGIPAMIFGPALAVNPTTAALIGLAVLLATGVLSWEDVLKHKGAWDTVVWFSALVMMASFLGKLGLIGWLSQTVGNGIDHMGMSWGRHDLADPHLFVFSLFLRQHHRARDGDVRRLLRRRHRARRATGAAGPDPGVLFLVDDVADALRHRHRADHLRLRLRDAGEWWKAGLVMSVVNLLIWMLIGGAWWKLLGYW